LFDWCRTVYSSHGSISFIIMWVIWKAWNVYIFNNKRTRVQESVTHIQSLLSACSAAFGTQAPGSSHSVTESLVEIGSITQIRTFPVLELHSSHDN
jgi:hypothetical protein